MTIENSGLRIRNLRKTYANTTRSVLNGIDLDSRRGSFTAIVGASGSGKSTLLRLIGGLDEPTVGSIEFDGRAPDEIRRSRQVGWMAQHPALLPWKTVWENIALPQRIEPTLTGHLRPDDLIDIVGLSNDYHKFPHELSGGMQQRAALARTLALGAPLWLMDEPFSALDDLTREELANELLHIWTSIKSTVVWVTHHLYESVKLADRIIVLTPTTGSVAGDIEVDLQRPRDESSIPFQNVVQQTRSALRGVDAQTVGLVR